MADLETYLADLSSAAPVPGGGSVAALQVAMGAALLAMVANLTIGKKRYADVQNAALAARDVALAARDEAVRLARADEEAYQQVAAAMALPKSTEEEALARLARLQEVLAGAAQPPLDTMRLAVRVIQLARELVSIGNRTAISDVGTAALAASSGYCAAMLNVEANLTLLRDPERKEALQAQFASVPHPEDQVRDIVHSTLEMMRMQGER